jgi:hypothetical protein
MATNPPSRYFAKALVRTRWHGRLSVGRDVGGYVKVGSAEDVRILRTSKLEYVSRLSVQCREDACRLRISSKPRVSDSAFLRISNLE